MKEARVQIEAIVSVMFKNEDVKGMREDAIAEWAEQIVRNCLYYGATGEYKAPKNRTVFDNPDDGIYMRNYGMFTAEVDDVEEDE